MALPVVTRELRSASRASGTYWLRMVAGCAATLVLAYVVLVSAAGWATASQVGAQLTHALKFVFFAAAIGAGSILAGDSVSAERRSGTLALVLGTRVGAIEFVLSKAIAPMLPGAGLLLAILPVQSLALVMGGVTSGELARTAVLLAVVLCHVLGVTILVSTLCTNGRLSILAALVFNIASLFLLPLFDYLARAGVGGGGWADPGRWTQWGAGYAVFFTGDLEYRMQPRGFWFGLMVSVVLALAALAASVGVIRYLRRHDLADVPAAKQKRVRLPSRLRRRAVLDMNPALWPQSRQSTGAPTFLLLGVAAAGLWLVAWTAFEKLRSDVIAILLFLAVSHVFLKLWLAWDASRQPVEDCRSGAFEMLATTPLSDSQIRAGWMVGLRRRFLLPIMIVLGADLLFALRASQEGEWWIGEVPVGWTILFTGLLLIADAYALAWAGVFNGLARTTHRRAVFSTVVGIWGVPMLAFTSILLFIAIVGSEVIPPETLPPAALLIWVAVGLMADIGFTAVAALRIRDGLRLVREWD